MWMRQPPRCHSAAPRSTQLAQGGSIASKCWPRVLISMQELAPEGDLFEWALLNGLNGHGSRRMWPLFLRAGAEIPTDNTKPYLVRVRNAGGFQRWRLSVTRIASILETPLLRGNSSRSSSVLAPRGLLPGRRVLTKRSRCKYLPPGRPWLVVLGRRRRRRRPGRRRGPRRPGVKCLDARLDRARDAVGQI